MHAYLLVGQEITSFQSAISNLAKEKNAKILNYPIKTIEDVRSLTNLIRLTLTEPTLIVSENIHEAGIAALNAFLKNLEEPQENLYFVLTAPSVRKVIPTIVSRAQIIKIRNQESGMRNEEIEKFLEMEIGQKLAYIDKIKDRGEAVELAESLVKTLHGRLHENGVQYKEIADKIEAAQETLTRLKGNGNVNLQLTNLAININ